MNNTTDPRSNRRTTTVRTLALSLAIAASAATLYVATTPRAEAANALAKVVSHGGLIASLHGHDQAAMHAHFEKVLDEAGATQAQKDQIRAIVNRAMDSQHADMRRYHDTMARLKALLTAPGIDVAAVNAVRAEQEQLALATSDRLTDTALAIAKVLTPAQRQTLGTAIDEMMATHMGHHSR